MNETLSSPSGTEDQGGNAVPSVRRTPAWLSAVVWVWIGLVVFCLGFVPLRTSNDPWWHLKTGKFIVEMNDWKLPATDVFTYTAADYPWHNHEWLSQVFYYLIWRWGDERSIGGWRTIILLKSLLLTATYLMLGRFLWQRGGAAWRGLAPDSRRGLVIALGFVLVTAAVGRRTFFPRPPVVSYFFMVFFLYTMWLHRTGRIETRWLGVLALLMPLWANLHGGFIVGGVIAASYCAAEGMGWVWHRLRGRQPHGPDSPCGRRFVIYMVLGMVLGVGSLLNPFGYHVYLLTKRVMSSQELVSRIVELNPPDFTFTWAYAFLLVVLGVGVLWLLAANARRPREAKWPPLGEVFVALFFLWQSINHVRHLPWFGIAVAPVAAWLAREAWARWGKSGRRALAMGLTATGVICGAWLLFVPGEGVGFLRALTIPGPVKYPPSIVQRNLQLLRGQAIQPGAYPEAAVRFILTARPPGRMYNRDHLAGYIIWKLAPEHYRVFTDSRFDIFGDDFLADELSIANGWPDAVLKPYNTPIRDWREVVEDWKINWLFIPKGELVHGILLEDPSLGWALIYQDRIYAIWIRRLPENQPWIDQYEIKPEQLPESRRESHL